jgi:hypothetical protein
MSSYASLRSTDAHQAIEGGQDVSQSESEQTQYHGASFELARAETSKTHRPPNATRRL